MTFNEIWKSLVPLYDEREARAVARLLLEDGFGLSLTDIYSGRTRLFDEAVTERLLQLLHRLQQGEPVQYVVGSTVFRDRRFRVSQGVLIPRVETAQLVDLVKAQKPDARRILDIGTGSGCIAISLKLELPQAEVDAIDVSAGALEVAQDNARRLGAEVRFRQADVFNFEATGKYDVIVSNPPYIEVDETAAMARNVLDYEPRAALFTREDDPLCFCRAIAGVGVKSLNAGGVLAMEINPRHAKALPSLMSEMGYLKVEIVKDCFGKDRFVRGTISTMSTIGKNRL